MASSQTNNVTSSETPKLQYGKVILSLENCILPQEKVLPTPSLTDGLDLETEMDLRILGCELIQTSGILLRLPQVAMATGQVLFQRFYYSKSFVRHSMEIVAMACITLASKIEEAPRRIRDVINVFHHIKQVRSGKNIQPLILDQNYINLKNQVIKAERRILKELGFCVHVKHPHKIIVTLLEVLKCKNQTVIMQTAWNYMNDSLRTNVFVRYHPETIACACIYLSARLLKMPLPNKPPWYLIFNVTEDDIQDICYTILRLYARKKTDPEKLEKTVEELRKAHQEAKLKAKGISGNSTPTPNAKSGFSPGSRPNSPKQGHSPIDIKKEKDHNSAISPKNDRELNHVNQQKRKILSPSPKSPSPVGRKDKSESSGSHSESHSPSPKRRTKTPPRSYKPVHRARSRSRMRDAKEGSKHHRSFHKRKRSYSRSRSKSHSPPHRHSKKSYKKEREKMRHLSRSHSRERNHHSNSYEKPHKSKKERTKDISNHRSRSRERSRR